MKKYIITSDSTCDLPDDLCQKLDIPIIPVYYCFSEKIYGKEIKISLSDFYERMRDGDIPTTIAPNIEDTIVFFESLLHKCTNIIHIAFSSALSSTYQNACIAASEVMERHDCNIKVIDSRCASLGEGLLVYKSVNYMKDNHSFNETIAYIEDVKNKIAHIFTVDDLVYLQHGGRVSKKTVILGNLINIKPILHVNLDGELILLDKVRGRKKSIVYLLNSLIENMSGDNDTIMISHCDAMSEVLELKEHIKEATPIKNIIINQISPAIGSHSGPGTIAIFYETDSK